jgi:hypothetical protein
LTDADKNLALYYQHAATGQITHTEAARMRKGADGEGLVINGEEYVLRISASDGGQNESRKPLPCVEELWDRRAQGFLEFTGELREQVKKLRQKEAETLRGHLFVPSAAADVVEAHFDLLWKEAEKLELEIRGIRNSYKKIRER